MNKKDKKTLLKVMELIDEENRWLNFSCVELSLVEKKDYFKSPLRTRYEKFYEFPREVTVQGLHWKGRETTDRRLIMLALFMVAEKDIK